MAVITWDVYEVSLSQGDILTVTVRELSDGVPVVIDTTPEGVDVYRVYSAGFHKSHPETLWKKELKRIILEDRAKKIEEDILKTKLDLSDFETYLNA